jgi:dynein heavy chain
MWMSRFALIDSVILSWSDVQRSWSSLQTIFSSSKDIRSQLPKETKRFDGVDAEWRELMGSAHEAPAVLEACTSNLLTALDKMKLSLDICQLALADYVEIKRKKFPRLYFVSYMDILDILSHGNNPGTLGSCS